MRFALPIAVVAGLTLGCEADERRMQRAVEAIQSNIAEHEAEAQDDSLLDTPELRIADRRRFTKAVKREIKAIDRRIRQRSRQLRRAERQLAPEVVAPLRERMLEVRDARARLDQEWGELKLIDQADWKEMAGDVDDAIFEVERRMDRLEDALDADYG